MLNHLKWGIDKNPACVLMGTEMYDLQNPNNFLSKLVEAYVKLWPYSPNFVLLIKTALNSCFQKKIFSVLLKKRTA